MVVSLPFSKDTVAKKCEDNEEDREGHSFVNTALRLDAIVHHHVPVLAGQDLSHMHKYSHIHRCDQATQYGFLHYKFFTIILT